MDAIINNVSENELYQLAKSYKLSMSGTKNDIVRRLMDHANKSKKSSCGDVSRESLLNYLMFHLSQRKRGINLYLLPLMTTTDLCGLATGNIAGEPVMVKNIIEIPDSDAVCGQYTKTELKTIASMKKNMPTKEELELLDKQDLCKIVLGGQRIIRRPYDVGNFFRHRMYSNHITVLRDRDDAFSIPGSDSEFIEAYEQTVLLPFDQNTMERYARYLRGIIYKNGFLSFVNEENIRLITKHLNDKFSFKKMNTNSVYGTVFKMYYKNQRGTKPEACALLKVENIDIVIDKYDQVKSKYREVRLRRQGELVHELAIGSVLNKLRVEVPVFMYTYAGFYCSSDENGEICKDISDKKITCLNLYEIIDGVPLYKSTVSTKNDAVKVIWQIIWGLYCAQKHFKFVHFDLHADNILVSKHSTNVVCSHTFNSETIKFSTAYIPRIIDYGRSSLVSNNVFISPMQEITTVPAQNIEDFALDPKRYFLGTFDIARYIRDVCSDLYLSKSKRELGKFIFDTFYTFFLERASQVIIPDEGLKELFTGCDGSNPECTGNDYETFMKRTVQSHNSRDYTIAQLATAYNLYTEPIDVYMQWVFPRIREHLN